MEKQTEKKNRFIVAGKLDSVDRRKKIFLINTILCKKKQRKKN